MNSLLISLQNWISSFGSSIYAFLTGIGGLGVLVLAIADSSFLSFPEGNDLLIVVLSTGKSWSNMVYYVGMTTVGSVIGCLLLYFVGRRGGNPLLRRRFSEQSVERAEKLFKRYGILTVLIPSILPPPLPFKIFVLSAGVFRLRISEFVLAVTIGRTIRYSMWGILAVLYGNHLKIFMQQNLNAVGGILLAGFVIAAAAVIVYYLKNMKAKRVGKEI
jgi:membrane protein DedA with SNARE-associated domain